ncbi:hypothetical protein MSSIH_0646 [Methanosarcina siciliae HI350]|uniref:AbiJ N-terminal domain-containing protein n=2 Tax=Methanosarcina siciliae TaxID=38027 RepID=A0A0E3LA36_9EURY|nr:hypothetical protein MSSIH_0646 [Methanosarcina siciliae HI350]
MYLTIVKYMKLNPSVVSQLALMVCGDGKYKDIFPYRSSSYLTEFFRNIDLDYIHDGSTRRLWVQNVLDELNSKENKNEECLPSPEIIKVIEQLLYPSIFITNNPSVDREKAVEMMNELLKGESLLVKIDTSTEIPKLTGKQGDFISTAIDERKTQRTIIFCPDVFKLPEETVDLNLVAVMMPFSSDFNGVYDAIKESCRNVGVNCQRVDDIWKNSTIIQDIFELIYTSSIVIADLSGKNPNVFYEIGIAHTLGKTVIPIVQNFNDIPFDLQHHRALTYLNNNEGRDNLQKALEKRLISLINNRQLKRDK